MPATVTSACLTHRKSLKRHSKGKLPWVQLCTQAQEHVQLCSMHTTDITCQTQPMEPPKGSMQVLLLAGLPAVDPCKCPARQVCMCASAQPANGMPPHTAMGMAKFSGRLQKHPAWTSHTWAVTPQQACHTKPTPTTVCLALCFSTHFASPIHTHSQTQAPAQATTLEAAHPQPVQCMLSVEAPTSGSWRHDMC